ncbi:MAG: hypothetical protein ABIP74_04655 [Candidatus Saccharimonas sp.]
MNSDTNIHALMRTLREKLVINDGRLIVTISGPSGSGKTTVVHQLTAALGEPIALLHTDDYYIGKTRMQTEMPSGETLNFDHPASLELTRLAQDITKLRDGATIESPIYDMAVSEPTSNTRTIHPAQVIMVEGIAANIDEIRMLSDISIYVTAPVEVRLQRCIQRDAIRNLRSESEVRQHFETNVVPSYEKYFQIADANADFTLES